MSQIAYKCYNEEFHEYEKGYKPDSDLQFRPPLIIFVHPKAHAQIEGYHFLLIETYMYIQAEALRKINLYKLLRHL